MVPASRPVRPASLAGRVLVGEPDDAERGLLAAALRDEGMLVETALGGEELLDRVRTGDIALVILELALPGLGGLDGCRLLRAISDVPLLVVTVHDSQLDRVLGFDAGADQYMGKPYSIVELLSRVRAILRRSGLDAGRPRLVQQIGDLRIDLASQSVSVAGEDARLTPTEFRLLAFLATKPGHVFTPGEILRHLWKSRFVGEQGACKAHIANLRRKVEADPARPRLIVTMRGRGYALSVKERSFY